MGDFLGWLFAMFFCDTPSVFRYAVASEEFATRQRKCFYAIAGTACWAETLAGDNAFTLSRGQSRGMVGGGQAPCRII